MFAIALLLGSAAGIGSAGVTSAELAEGCTSVVESPMEYVDCYFYKQEYEVRRTVTSMEPCQIGWSHRQAERPVAVTSTYLVREYERYYTVFDFNAEEQLILQEISIVTDETWLSSTTEYGKCEPVTGPPPRS
jgi:hypothetical protein